MKQTPQRVVWKDHESLSYAAACFFLNYCLQSVARNGRFVTALSGGSTPARFLEILASPVFSRNIPWKKVFFFWSDERFVLHNSPDSNFNLARTNLLDKIDIPSRNIFPVPVSGDPEQCARQYELSVKKIFDKKPASFDWLMLGTGKDGHTASLFPHTPVLIENRRLVKQVWLEDKQAWRITFTYPLINKAKQIIVLVSGAEKAPIVDAVFKKPSKKIYPIQYIEAAPSIWMMDEAARGEP